MKVAANQLLRWLSLKAKKSIPPLPMFSHFFSQHEIEWEPACTHRRKKPTPMEPGKREALTGHLYLRFARTNGCMHIALIHAD